MAILAPDATDKAVCYPKVEAALRLIQEHDPRRFRQVQRYVRAISLGAHPLYLGQWFEDVRMCELSLQYVLAPETTPSQVAATIVHEMTHARLHRLGIGYGEGGRPRVEAICHRAELEFVSRLPDAAAIIPGLQRALERDPAYYADSQFLARDVDALRRLGCPEWIVKAFRWARRSRAA